MFDLHVVSRALPRARANTGNRIAARIAMIAITTSNSMSVNPRPDRVNFALWMLKRNIWLPVVPVAPPASGAEHCPAYAQVCFLCAQGELYGWLVDHIVIYQYLGVDGSEKSSKIVLSDKTTVQGTGEGGR